MGAALTRSLIKMDPVPSVKTTSVQSGLATAGLLPSINSLIRRNTPADCLGRIYGLNQAAQFVGMFSGSILGGWLAASIGIASVFLIPGVLLLINAGWFRFMVYRP